MAIPSTRNELKAQALRNLGNGVHEINTTDAQLEDRIDEALLKFQEFHYDAVERLYSKYQITQTDIDNEYITVNDNSLVVVKIFPIPSYIGGSNEFSDVRYQYALNHAWSFISSNMRDYVFNRTHMESISQWLNPNASIRHIRARNRLYIDTNWKTINVGDYFLIDEYRILDPEGSGISIYSNNWLLKYTTALFKLQWATNLKKYQGIALLGNITLDASELYQEAKDEIEKLETELREVYEYPPIGGLG